MPILGFLCKASYVSNAVAPHGFFDNAKSAKAYAFALFASVNKRFSGE